MQKGIALLLTLLAVPLGAQAPYLVKDINTTYSSTPKSSSPAEFTSFAGKTFFAATTDDAGTELWSTDGTSSATSMVADIIPGTGSSNPSELMAVNGVLLFNARDVNHGIELWATDGTAAGTHLVADINPGPTSSEPAGKTLYKNRVLFSADDGTNGRELWTTDGTSAGTRMLKDIAPGSGSSAPAYFVTLGDSVYFAAAGGLWKTDGTEPGTVQVAAVTARNLRVAGSQLFFEGLTAAAGWEPWVSDGTGPGTRLVADILPGPDGALDSQYSYLGFTAFGNRVLFLANDGVHGRELWISDGTAAGTRLVRDIVPGPTGTWDNGYAYIATLGDRAFFSAKDPEHGQEVWVTDGTEAGTAFFADLDPGPDSSYPVLFVASGSHLFFGAYSGDVLRGNQLWATDGTVAGTHVVGGTSGPQLGDEGVSLWPVDGKLYFSGENSLNGYEPWVTDGTDAGTHLIANIAPDVGPSSFPSSLTAAGNLLFFYASEGLPTLTVNGLQSSLWRSDGTGAGTLKLMDSGQNPGPLLGAGPLVFFQTRVTGQQLLMSDGTPEGTKAADDFLSRFGPSRFGMFFPFGDTLFATVFDLGVYDTSLWKTTAAPNATAIRLGARNPFGLVEVAGHYMFYAEAATGPYDYALWTTDGTPAGTYAIIPELKNDDSAESALVNAAGTVFFLNTVRGENPKLWKSDGTYDGTTVVKELPPGNTYQPEIKAAGHRVFFVVGGGLWTSDGTDSGTIQLTPAGFYPPASNLTPVGNRIVFAQTTSGGAMIALWGSDGTVAGTQALLSLGLIPTQPVSIDGVVYFAGSDVVHGNEVWTTDGTVEGTKLLADVNPGLASSFPSGFTKAGNTVYFSATNDATGNELWAISLPASRLSIDDVRVTEGDAGTTPARFTVTLNPAATQTVAVDYSTSDGTATAGQDYDAASGTLTFAPGETAKTVDVAVRGDVLPENNETFFVTLGNANGAGILKNEGTGIIDDDDQFADLSVVSQFQSASGSGIADSVNVSDNGPRSATDVIVKFTNTPPSFLQHCTACSIPEIAVDTSSTVGGEFQAPNQQTYLSATATARQRDPQATNNTATWTINGDRSMAMSPAYLTPGGTTTVSALTLTPAPAVTSSDPSVVSVPSNVTALTSGFGTFTVTALKPGTSAISIAGDQSPLLVTVVAAGTQPRWPGGLSFRTDSTAITFERPLSLTVTSGTAPVSGATATGTVVVTTTGGLELDRRSVTGAATITLPVYFPAVGQIPYTITYDGDANFLPQTSSGSVDVYPGNATLTGELDPIPGVAGAFSLTVRATGSPVAAPTGSLSILSGGVQIAVLPLISPGGATSQAQATLTGLPASPTLTINYLGDTRYSSGVQQIRVVPPRPHLVRQ